MVCASTKLGNGARSNGGGCSLAGDRTKGETLDCTVDICAGGCGEGDRVDLVDGGFLSCCCWSATRPRCIASCCASWRFRWTSCSSSMRRRSSSFCSSSRVGTGTSSITSDVERCIAPSSDRFDWDSCVLRDEADRVDTRVPDDRFFLLLLELLLLLLLSSFHCPVVLLSRTNVNSSSSGTASSSSSSLGKISPRELNESVVCPDVCVSLLCLLWPLCSLPFSASSSLSSIKGCSSSMLLRDAPGCSVKSAALGLYRRPFPPILNGRRPRKPK